ncbi:probable nucleoredoxin 1-1 [Morus notabilis]|uniref:probable nucleoredoxin 1-1 n=1 Tax=Morus notabilis TaxID=981085 RepID=UPI000CECFEB6|nr:probable nucleoredoxin 1-1 [Morus notabilis]
MARRLISSLIGKIVGIYLNTPKFMDPYGSFVSKVAVSKGDFEVVFVCYNAIHEEEFNDYFAKMPWLAIPFPETNDIKQRLRKWFRMRDCGLIIIHSNGEILTQETANHMTEWFGEDAYPFTQERFNFLKDQVEASKRNQSITSLLISKSRDFLLSNHGNYQVKLFVALPVSECELVGKTVCLYFGDNHLKSNDGRYSPCPEFTFLLVYVYNKLKEKGEKFEVVFLSCDQQIEEFKQGLEIMPWLTLPFKDNMAVSLWHYFDFRSDQHTPQLVIIGPDGKTLNKNNVVALIEEYGIDADPFTQEKVDELVKAKEEVPHTLESLLVYGDKDFVIRKNGCKVLVSELVGKNILLFINQYEQLETPKFTKTLIRTYLDIKANKDKALEVIFIAANIEDEWAFDECFSRMPWLALPYRDARKKRIQRIFQLVRCPTIIAIDTSGQVVTNITSFHHPIIMHGAEAYPFTEERFKYMKKEVDKMAKGSWPQKLKHELHAEHELLLMKDRQLYTCSACMEFGTRWTFFCKQCKFNLHPKCALDKQSITLE